MTVRCYVVGHVVFMSPYEFASTIPSEKFWKDEIVILNKVGLYASPYNIIH